MLTSFNEIKAELAEEMKHQDIENILWQYAESNSPTYTADIIAEWGLMPSEFNDSWREYGKPSFGDGITDLMRQDLFNYYMTLVVRAYEELTTEAEQDN